MQRSAAQCSAVQCQRRRNAIFAAHAAYGLCERRRTDAIRSPHDEWAATPSRRKREKYFLAANRTLAVDRVRRRRHAPPAPAELVPADLAARFRSRIFPPGRRHSAQRVRIRPVPSPLPRPRPQSAVVVRRRRAPAIAGSIRSRRSALFA